jgi:hypothetical protein
MTRQPTQVVLAHVTLDPAHMSTCAMRRTVTRGGARCAARSHTNRLWCRLEEFLTFKRPHSQHFL